MTAGPLLHFDRLTIGINYLDLEDCLLQAIPVKYFKVTGKIWSVSVPPSFRLSWHPNGHSSGCRSSMGSDCWDWRSDHKHFTISPTDIVNACAPLLELFSIYGVALAFNLELLWRPRPTICASVFHLPSFGLAFYLRSLILLDQS